MFRTSLCFLAVWSTLLAGDVRADEPGSGPGYFRYPTLSDNGIVFTAAGDLWRVGIRGGEATRLTTKAGEESHAAVSPDGTQVAFSATFDGPTEVYVQRLIDGALPVRLTYEIDGAIVVGWTTDGAVLYTTRRHGDLPGVHLARVDPVTRDTTVLPLSLASDGRYDDEGVLYVTRFAFQGSFTKRYQGGGAQSIWRFRPGATEAEPLTANFAGTSRSPMPWRGRIYFQSDRDGTMNVWSMLPDGRDLRQHTHHVDFDVQGASLRGGRIVYQLAADLRVLDVTNGEDVLVPIRLTSMLTQGKERGVPAPAEWISSAHLSPTGDRLALTARGQVFVAPVKKGPVSLAAREPGVRYRDARFLSDGHTLVALADRTGEFEFWTFPADASRPPIAVSTGATVTRRDGVPSPDGRFVAHQDQDQRLWVHDVVTGEGRIVATSETTAFRDLRWSADGQWLAYVQTGANALARIWLYGVRDGKARPVTTDRFDSYSPTWSPDGAWLYFLSDRTFDSLVASPWGARQPEPFFDRQTRVYQLALKHGARSRFATKDERTTPARDPLDIGAGADGIAVPGPGAIDFDGLAARVSDVPLVPGNYSSLDTDGQRLYFLSWDASAPGRKALRMMPIGDSRGLETLAGSVDRYEVSLDGSTLLLVRGDDLLVLPADGTMPHDVSRTKVVFGDWTLTVQPRDEWRQIFVDAWRQQRDGFYDRGMHGVDWVAMRARYEPLIARVTDRAELGDLVAQMVGELSALHMYVHGGDVAKGDEALLGSLGATLVRDEHRGGYRVTRVFIGDPDLPGERSPLAAPHADVREGDVITAVDGVSSLVPDHIQLLLRDALDKDVRLRVVAGDSGTVRDVVVRPISSRRAAELRYRSWEIERRRRVDEAAAGTIGYLHLRAMNAADMAEWQRAFYPVQGRQGLIIDLRRNTGGNIDSWLLSRLLRQAWFYWQPRTGHPTPNMPSAYRGHIAVLVDQETASDGEAFAEGVRRLGLGVVIGTRTWGGEIWGSVGGALVDRGTATVPDTGVFSAQGEWMIEGHGVDPDVVVENLPAATFRGEDAQLAAAVAYLEQRIREAPVPTVKTPRYPDKRAPIVTSTAAR
ncbi:Tricorn protease [Luteitalea pratensis]|uniref:Tricorn protease homolog n=1 Tax=Luteitalea pratensis TaxID=1855912 RepID=A0A143PUP4_LUTPR|nr:S41 family peptidase [Luteitalea pratensis]AMY11908.1 Tricorn protease [Luteitalea pratensis]